MPLELILTIQGHFGSCRANLGPLVMFWTILGPPGVPKRPQSGPMWHIMMYYTCEKCFRATWTLPGRLLACWSISASGLLSWATNLNFATLKNFWWGYQKNDILSSIMVLEGHFGAIWAIFEMMFLRKIDFCIYPILAQNGLFLVPRPPFGPHSPKT